jgi:diacylglycerol O-acyltransferase / wax synthase
MGPMPLNDAMFLLGETRDQPMHVGGLQLFRLPDDAEPHHVRGVYRTLVEEGVVHPRLRRRPARMFPGGPWRWEVEDDIDLEHHLRHSALPDPGRVRELLALVSRLHGTLLDRSRPLWESHLIEGLADGRIATYTKIHHALMDGVSQMRLLDRGLSADPDERGMVPPMFLHPGAERRPRGGAPEGEDGRNPLRRAAAAATSGLGAGVEGVRAVTGATEALLRSVVRSFSDQAAALPYTAPASPLNVNITGARRFAADSWPLERLRAVGKGLGGTLNDVVLALCAGALRRYLGELDGLPDAPLVAMVPVSLRDSDDDSDDTGNAVGLILCNLGTDLADPVERFARIHESAQLGKLQLQGLNQLGVLALGALSLAPVGVTSLARLGNLPRPPFNLVISNVPGPSSPRYWNGAELVGSYPTSIPFHGQALNITCTSWADRLGFGLIGCRRSVPRLQRMLDHLETSLVELERAA